MNALHNFQGLTNRPFALRVVFFGKLHRALVLKVGCIFENKLVQYVER